MSISQTSIKFVKKQISNILFNRGRKRWHKKCLEMFKNINPEKKNINLNIEEHKRKWEKVISDVNPIWYKSYTYISGKEDIDYVPDDIYYMLIEPKLNRIDMVPAYRDKNMYDKQNSSMPGVYPDVILRNIEGVFYDKHYNKMNSIMDELISIDKEKLVLKPSIDSGSGKNVRFFFRKNGSYISNQDEKLDLEFLQTQYGKNYILQNYITQHKYFDDFNKSSLNSIRVTTYRSVINEDVVILHANLRMGGEGSFVDNVGAGGAAVHVFPDGTLQNFASDKFGNHLYSPPSSNGIKFSEIGLVPYWDQICKIAKKLAKNYYYFRILGFDFCLQEDGKVRLIEINFSGLGIGFQNDSGSLFGKYTDEVIEYCSK